MRTFLSIRRLVFLFGLAACAAAGFAHAQDALKIEIVGWGARQIPVAIADFSGDATARALTSVVRGDLEQSGLFRLIDPGSALLTENSNIDHAEWSGRGVDALAAGSLGRTADGRMEARFRLHDVSRKMLLGGAAYVTATAQLRGAGHRIADYIYEKLIGERGIFSTRIAYVSKSGKRYALQVADYDGQNARTALISNEPIMSPVWAPDGERIAYVSFENKKPIVFVHSLTTGQRLVAANFKGSNSAPAWSPDGARLAVALTRDGHSQIYTIPAGGGAPRQLTTSAGIDTEPRFSADGAFVYFTSDRGGSPQIYRVASQGGSVERITFEGSYNVSPRPSPDGRSLAFITRREGRFQLAVMELSTRQIQVLSDSGRDESPSFAPNGRMIVFATQIGGRGVLSAVSADGRIRQRLSISAGDVREPDWGPFPP